MDNKILYIISGCNGAGKTTASYTILPDIWQCNEFVNADENLIERAQGKGYQVKLLFFWLDSPQTAIERVAQRVREGGHSIPSDIIIRRYYAGIKNLFNIYMNCVDYWVLANNTNGSSEYIAEGGKGTDSNIFDSETYNKVLHYVRG